MDFSTKLKKNKRYLTIFAEKQSLLNPHFTLPALSNTRTWKITPINHVFMKDSQYVFFMQQALFPRLESIFNIFACFFPYRYHCDR